MNNTPIVAMLIPVVETWAPSIGHDKSKFLMPLSFASMLGECADGDLHEPGGGGPERGSRDAAVRLFDIVPVGGPCAIAGIIYMAVFSKYLLRSSSDRGSERGSGDGVGKSEKVLSRTYGVFLFSTVRGNHDIGERPWTSD